jgi:thiamine biosynthesis protein ThiI
LFSILRERAGAATAQLELPEGAQVRQAVDHLVRRFPRLAPLLEGAQPLPLQYAVNREYVAAHQTLSAGDELALLPPVSGGSGASDVGMLLLSGGFDSPVAGSLVQRSGRRLLAVHFTQEPFTDDASARKSLQLAKILGIETLFVVDLGNDLAEFTRKCDHKVYFVLLKRLMVRLAQEVARREAATFLVTGENLGQVSSQTLSNMGVIDAVAALPILRPLLGFDKEDILRIAQSIGTYETSKGPELCDLLGPKHPSTSTSRDQIDAEEAKVDVPAIVAAALSRMRTVRTQDAAPPSTDLVGCA